MKTDSIKWAAQLSHVREVSLCGVADLAFWRERLLAEGHTPAASADGHAQVLVIAAEGRFMGLQFREVSFSVVVEPLVGAESGDASFLLVAFNSRAFFAFCERKFFSTPYYAGDVRELSMRPAAVQVLAPGEGEFCATLSGEPGAGARVADRTEDAGWEGPVYLPAVGNGKQGGKMFFARLRGRTEFYPFVESTDVVKIAPTAGSDVLQSLVDSQFVPREWIVRADAMHAKSKTYARD